MSLNAESIRCLDLEEYDPVLNSVTKKCDNKNRNNDNDCNFLKNISTGRNKAGIKHISYLYSIVTNSISNNSTRLRRLLLKEFTVKRFLVYEKIKEIVKEFLQRLQRPKFHHTNKKSHMHQVFLCKCGWLLYNPTSLSCGHTICKQCADENMFCYLCEYTQSDPPNLNLVLSEAIKNWFPKESESTRHKMDSTALFDSKDYELALSEINIAIDFIRNDYTAYNIRAKIYMALGKFKCALNDTNTSVGLRENFAQTHFLQGVCYSNLGNLNDAIDAFQLCLELEPDDEELQTSVVDRLDEILSIPDHDNAIDTAGSESPIYDDNNTSGNNDDDATENNVKGMTKNTAREKNVIKEENKSSEETSLETQDLSENSQIPCLIASSESENGGDETGSLSSEIQSCTSDKDEKKLHGIPVRLLNEEDFECKLCYELLYKPVTMSCGHMFCKSCILRVLDHNPVCPICRLSLVSYLQQTAKPITFIMEEIMDLFFHKEYDERRKTYLEEMERMSRVGVDEDVHVPIFVCSIAFPYVKQSLHIFEPRYRLMIRECMESGSKKFGMCIPKSGEDYADVGTICELTSFHVLPDGRFIINILAGQRFIVQEKHVVDSMNYAKVTYFTDKSEDLSPEQFGQTSKRVYDHLSQYMNSLSTAEKDCIHNALGELPSHETNINQYCHGVPWIWWGLAALPLNFVAKLALLRSKCVSERLLSLGRFLQFLSKMQPTTERVGSQGNAL